MSRPIMYSPVSWYNVIATASKAVDGAPVATNKSQEDLLQRYEASKGQLDSVSDFLESCVSTDADIVNAFLKKRQFSVVIPPLGPSDLAVASVFDLSMRWYEPGIPLPLAGADQKTYDGFRVTANIYNANYGQQSVIAAAVYTGDLQYRCYFFMPVEAPKDLHELETMIQSFKINSCNAEYKDVLQCPSVDTKSNADMSWIMNLTFSSPLSHKVTQAFDESQLMLDYKGARARSAAAVSMRAGCAPGMCAVPKKTFVLDQAFVMFVVDLATGSKAAPLFMAYVPPTAWRYPSHKRAASDSGSGSGSDSE